MRVRTKLKVLALASCAALAAMALALAGCGGGASGGSTGGTPVSMEESYRVISVTEHNGSSIVTRGGGEVIALYDGLSLQSGDDVVTGSGADLTMLIDSDKYLYAAENTHFWLEASGKEGSSHTTIHLEEGGVLFRLDTKLNAGESYQVSTPNATMSVRGTSGWVEVTNSFTSRVSLLEGTLTVTSSEPATGEMRQVTVSAGQTATATVNKGTGGGSGQSGMSELQLTVERMTKQDVKLFASSGSTKTSTLEKILEFSADSGKTMNFGSSSITPQEAEKILKDSKQSSTQTGSANISKAVLKTMSTNSASQQQAPAEQESAEQQPAHEHSYTSKVVARASCTKKGKVEYSCACGDKYTETIPMKEHNYVTVPGKDSTCTETGLTVGMSCSVCNKVKLEQYETPALGHDIVEDPEVPATCTEPGKAAVQHCSRCNYTAGGEELAATGHNYVSNGGSAATCTEPGYSSSTCTRCGDTTSSSTPALGHSYNDGKCIRCGKGEFECDHVYESHDIEFCTRSPQRVYTCTKCGNHYTEDLPGEPLGHRWELIAEGKYECARCEATHESSQDECKHEFSVTGSLEPSCYQSGYTKFTCMQCGFTYEEKIEASHKYDETGKCTECEATRDGYGELSLQSNEEGEGEENNQTKTVVNEAAVLEDEPSEETPAEGEPVS